MSKNLAKFHMKRLFDDDYEGFGNKFEKTKKKVGESVDIKRVKNVTKTRLKAKEYKNYDREEDYFFD